MRNMRILMLLFVMIVGNLQSQQPEGRSVLAPEICFSNVVGNSSFPAFNKLIEKNWGINTLTNALKQELPHIEVTQNRSARYFGMAKVAMVEYWRVRFAFPSNVEVFLAKVHLLVFVYNIQEQVEVVREIFTAYSVESVDKDRQEAPLVLLKTAFEKCVVLAAQKIADKVPLKGTVHRVTDIIVVDLGKRDGIQESNVLEFFTATGETLGRARVIDVLSDECVAYQRGGVGGLTQGCYARLTQKAREIVSSESDVLPTVVPKYVDPLKKMMSPNPLRDVKIVNPVNNRKVFMGIKPVSIPLEIKGYDTWGDEVPVEPMKIKWKVTTAGKMSDLRDTATLVVEQPGIYTISASYEQWDTNKTIDSKPVEITVLTINAITLSPREIVIAPGESYQFAVAVDGKDASGRPIDLNDIQRQIKWTAEPARLLRSLAEDGGFVAGDKSGKCLLRAFIDGATGVDAQAKIMVLPPVSLDILNLNDDGNKVKETTITVSTGMVLKLKWDISTNAPDISADDISLKWNVAEANQYGEIAYEQNQLFFRAGAKGTSVPIKIGVMLANLPESSQRKDSQVNVWVQIHAKPPEYYFKQSLEFTKNKKHEDALQAMSTVIEINPQYPEAYRSRGKIQRQLKHYEEAEQDFMKAIEVEPRNATNYYSLACLYSILKKQDAALRYLELAIVQGFKKLNLIERDSDLANLRKTKEYKAIIKKYRKNLSDEPDEDRSGDDE